MRIVKTVTEAREAVSAWKKDGDSIGFVPTMGYLHEGHLELIRHAASENGRTAVSIFVNPTQFGPNEDFESYPRDLERDLQLAEEAGADLVFAPEPAEIYRKEPSVKMAAAERVDVLCGKSRPGHFDGVVTVLTKLFHIIQPDRAYFGKKDAQQVAVIKGLADEFFFPLEIIPVETVRESDGLAKSSRNVFLSEQERSQAPKIYQALQAGRVFFAEGASAEEAMKEIRRLLGEIQGGQTDYAEILQYPELVPVTEHSREVIAAAAVKFSGARLIDNVIWNVNKGGN